MTNHVSPPSITQDFQHVDSSSKGAVSKVSWNPNFGYSRKQEIEAEREKELEAYRERVALEDPTAIRFLKLEAAVAQLQHELKELKGAS